MWCNKAYHYKKQDSIAAFGKVIIKQGDTIKLTSKTANYSGKTQLAFTAGNVVLLNPTSMHTFMIMEQIYSYSLAPMTCDGNHITITINMLCMTPKHVNE